MDRMSNEENEELKSMFAECVYQTAQSFNASTHECWIKFFAKLRPKFEVPTKHELSNRLLDKSFEKVSSLTEDYICKADYISIVIDGWTNVRKDSIINIIAMTLSPIFLKSIDTKGAMKDVC